MQNSGIPHALLLPPHQPGSCKAPFNFSLPLRHKSQRLPQHLLRGLRENYIPLLWDQHRLVPTVCSHFPIDTLYYTLRPVVAIAKTLPLLHPHLLPIGARPPPDPPRGRSYQALKTFLKGHLLQDWSLQSPPPCYTLTRLLWSHTPSWGWSSSQQQGSNKCAPRNHT